MSDTRETAANIFDRTAKLAAGLARGVPDPASTALTVASEISAAVAGLIRAIGVDGAAEAINELAARRDEGTITPADVAADDDSIVDAVLSMYDGDDEGDDEE